MVDGKAYDSLSLELRLVFEQIAAEVHKQWSVGRQKEGWKFGAVRDDTLKQTPCLVPYEQLSEQEKDYDRNTALCVICTLQKLGFTINKEF